MQDIDWLPVVFRWMHLTTVVVLAGGSLFNWLVIGPALRKLDDDQQRSVIQTAVGRIWKRIMQPAILLVLISGLAIAYWRAKSLPEDAGAYYAIFGSKVLLAMFVFFLASLSVGRSRLSEIMRRPGSIWPALLGLTIVVIIALAALLQTFARGTGEADQSSSAQHNHNRPTPERFADRELAWTIAGDDVSKPFGVPQFDPTGGNISSQSRVIKWVLVRPAA